MRQTGSINDLIIETFKKNEDSFVSGQDISNKIKISRTAVWKHIEGLRKRGYLIESIPSKGYRLVEIPDRLSPDEIRKTLQAGFIGKELLFFDEVDSTNDVAMQSGAKGLAEGLVVLSEGQSHGKGRMGRTWVSPNDILIDRKKVSGILTEMNAEQERINYIVAGIGINVNMNKQDFPEDLRMPATSLSECLGKRVDRMNLLLALIKILEQDYEELKNGGIVSIFRRWRKGCDILNRRIKVCLPNEEITGVAEDLTPEGGLIMRLDGREKRIIYAGDVLII